VVGTEIGPAGSHADSKAPIQCRDTKQKGHSVMERRAVFPMEQSAGFSQAPHYVITVS
jgi:hypothetical protein